jgi:hypothetical protein
MFQGEWALDLELCTWNFVLFFLIPRLESKYKVPSTKIKAQSTKTQDQKHLLPRQDCQSSRGSDSVKAQLSRSEL